MYKFVNEGGSYDIVLNDEIDYIDESYYISFLPANSDIMYLFDINCPQTLQGSIQGKVTRKAADVSKVILGNLYKQTPWISVRNGESNPELIDQDNNILNVTMGTLIELNGSDTDKNYIVGQISSNSSIDLYQSFIVSLNAKSLDGSIRKQIKGTPSVTGTVTLDNVTTDITAQYPTGNYIMLPAQNIREKINSIDCEINVSAAIDIDYSASQAAREAEFPSRPLNYGASYNQVGVNVSMSSNLAYENSEAKLAYSNMTAEPAIKSSKYYYINETDKATLVYNAVPKIDTYDKTDI